MYSCQKEGCNITHHIILTNINFVHRASGHSASPQPRKDLAHTGLRNTNMPQSPRESKENVTPNLSPSSLRAVSGHGASTYSAIDNRNLPTPTEFSSNPSSNTFNGLINILLKGVFLMSEIGRQKGTLETICQTLSKTVNEFNERKWATETSESFTIVPLCST
jgi:hypothetical protein